MKSLSIVMTEEEERGKWKEEGTQRAVVVNESEEEG